MNSKHDLCYPISQKEYELHPRRFSRSATGAIIDKRAIQGTLHTRTDYDHQKTMAGVDALCVRDFFSYVPCFTHDFGTDLNLDEIIAHLVQPRFTPGFQKMVFQRTPTDITTTVFRQEGVKELVTNPDIARDLEDSLNLFFLLQSELIAREQTAEMVRNWTNRKAQLRALTPHNLEILSQYTHMINSFSSALKEVQSAPLTRLKDYFQEIKESRFFQMVYPLFDREYFREYRISVEAGVRVDKVIGATVYKKSIDETKIPFSYLRDSVGFLKSVLVTGMFPTCFAMEATNAVVDTNLEGLTKMAEVVGSLEFYLCGAGFYRRMEKAGMSLVFPEILPKESRTLHLKQARNPLLLYQEGTNPNDSSRIRPNDIDHSPDSNLRVITGSNNGGKTCYVKTLGLLQILAQNGYPVTAEEGAKVSLVDDIYTHFIRTDDLMSGEGRLKNELRRIKEIFRTATPYSLLILDEPCGGTDAQEGTRESEVILQGADYLGSATYFTTHLHELAQRVEERRYPRVENLHVQIIDEPQTGRKIRTYRILPGKAESSYGAEIAREEGLTTDDLTALFEERMQNGSLPPRR